MYLYLYLLLTYEDVIVYLPSHSYRVDVGMFSFVLMHQDGRKPYKAILSSTA